MEGHGYYESDGKKYNYLKQALFNFNRKIKTKDTPRMKSEITRDWNIQYFWPLVGQLRLSIRNRGTVAISYAFGNYEDKKKLLIDVPLLPIHIGNNNIILTNPQISSTDIDKPMFFL